MSLICSAGLNHDAAWCDELASWKYAETWDMLMFGLRLGNDPRCVVTTTPKPVKLLRDLLATGATVVTRGSTYDNRGNLAPAFFAEIISKYEGTRLGRQELNAELLEDVPGALWQQKQIDALRVKSNPNLLRIVVAVDPAVTSGADSDEMGIVVCGKDVDGHGYVLADLSCKLTPDGCAQKAVTAFHEYGADRIVAETNNGGDLVERVIRTVDKNLPYKRVTASRGEATRAEPVLRCMSRTKFTTLAASRSSRTKCAHSFRKEWILHRTELMPWYGDLRNCSSVTSFRSSKEKS